MNPAQIQEKKRLDKLFKEGQSDLKTSFFSLKFSPDFLGAVVNFTDAAKGYRKIKLFQESLKSFEEAIKCNKKLLESWAEGQNYLEMAEIYLFELDDNIKGFQCLKNASFGIKLTGKLSMSVKIYMETAQKLLDKGKVKLALEILKEAYSDCKENTHDDLMRISLEEIFVKILDVLCLLEMFADAAELITSYVNIQKTFKDEKKYKVSKHYLYLGLIRLIMDEAYLVDSILDEMFLYYDNSCSDDVEDLRNCAKYFQELNKQKMNNLFTYSFSLFPTNLLKALRKAYDKKEKSGVSNEMRNVNFNNAPLNNNNNNYSNSDLNETRDKTVNSYLGDEEENSQQPNNNTAPAADDYL